MQDLLKIENTSDEELLQLFTYIRDTANVHIEALDGNILNDYLKVVEDHYFLHTILKDYTDEEIFRIALFIVREIYGHKDLTEDNCKYYEVYREDGKIDVQFYHDGYTDKAANLFEIPFKKIVKYRT